MSSSIPSTMKVRGVIVVVIVALRISYHIEIYLQYIAFIFATEYRPKNFQIAIRRMPSFDGRFLTFLLGM